MGYYGTPWSLLYIRHKSCQITPMPSTSIAQQHLMGAALSHKRTGGKASPMVKRLAQQMSEKDLKDFARTKTKDLPEHKEASTNLTRMHQLYGQ